MITSEKPALVRAVGVQKSFHGNTVLNGIDLDIADGEVVTIIGPSGSGKSTLLRALNGLEKLDIGYVEFDGEILGRTVRGGRLHELRPSAARQQRANIGMVFQGFNLFPHMTVLENLMEAPRAVRRVSRDEAQDRATNLLERVGLGSKASSYPRQLSGGQQQRVAIARALAMEPKLMLFDEPTSALDPELVGEVLAVIRDIAKDGTTMAIVTHEMNFARDVSHRTVFLEGGSIVSQGSPSYIFDDCDNERTKRFVTASAGRGGAEAAA